MSKSTAGTRDEGNSGFMKRARATLVLKKEHRKMLVLASSGWLASELDGRLLRYLRNRRLIKGTRTVTCTAAGLTALAGRKSARAAA